MKMSTANEITRKTMDKFLSDNRDLFACLKQKPEEVFERTSAAASIDKQAREEISTFIKHIDDEGCGKMAREGLHQDIYRSLARAFVKCLTNGAITQAMLLTDEADQQLLELKYQAGTVQRPAAAPVVPVLSPAEAFDAMIRDDWAHMPVDKLKAKKNANAQYRKRLNELLENGTLESQITQSHDGRNM
jgi:hypothetical protein